MMGLTEQRLLSIKVIIGLLAFGFLSSCQKGSYDGKLECILESVNIDKKGIVIEVGQDNEWTDTTILILVTYHKKSNEILIGGNLKGVYRGNDIYMYETNSGSTGNKKFNKIPNNINWYNLTPKEIDEDYISPPYDPINIQVEYDLRTNCFGEVFRGKGLIKENIFAKCKCKSK